MRMFFLLMRSHAHDHEWNWTSLHSRLGNKSLGQSGTTLYIWTNNRLKGIQFKVICFLKGRFFSLVFLHFFFFLFFLIPSISGTYWTAADRKSQIRSYDIKKIRQHSFRPCIWYEGYQTFPCWSFFVFFSGAWSSSQKGRSSRKIILKDWRQQTGSGQLR